MRGVLGCSDSGSFPIWCRPVYFLGVGDLYDDAALLALLVLLPAEPLLPVGVSLGVDCTPVTCDGESTVKSSSPFALSSSAPVTVLSSRSDGVWKDSFVSVCVTSSSCASSYPDRETLADASKNCFQN